MCVFVQRFTVALVSKMLTMAIIGLRSGKSKGLLSENECLKQEHEYRRLAAHRK